MGIPDVSLTRSRDGTTGVATFTFDNPSFLSAASEALGETTGMYLKDSGTMKTSEVTATFTNGKPCIVKGIMVMKGTDEWDRFMRSWSATPRRTAWASPRREERPSHGGVPLPMRGTMRWRRVRSLSRVCRLRSVVCV